MPHSLFAAAESPPWLSDLAAARALLVTAHTSTTPCICPRNRPLAWGWNNSVKLKQLSPQTHMEEIVRGSLASACGMCPWCVLAFASVTTVLKRLWNTLGAVREEAFTLVLLLHFFGWETFYHSAHNRAGESTGPFKHFCNTFTWFLVRRGLFSFLDLLCPIALHVTLLMSTRSASCEQASSPVLWLDNLHRCLHTPPFPSSICPRGLGPGRQGGREVEITKEKRGSTAEESRAGRLAWERGIRRQK